MDEEQIIYNTIRQFRQKRIEPVWDHLNTPERDRYIGLFAGLAEVGIGSLALDEEQGGLALSARARFDLFAEIGAASPALALGVIAHHTAIALVREASEGAGWPGALAEAGSSRFALIGSPLEPAPDVAFDLRSNGSLQLIGEARVVWPHPEWLVVRAREEDRDRLVVVRADAPGVTLAAQTSSHGLRFIPFGELRFESVKVESGLVFDWPSSGRAAREADGLLAAVLTGMVREMHQRSMAYALIRYQGGKMIHEHDAVQNLVGPMLVAEQALESLAVATLTNGDGPGDGAASSFAVELTRLIGLDAVQTFGGYGYMEDFRVERYLRDANTLETFWVQAAKRRRQIAVRRFAEMSK